MTTASKSKIIGYWVTTGIIVFVCFSGGLVDLLQPNGSVDDMVLLGYPVSFMTILGVWKLLVHL